MFLRTEGRIPSIQMFGQGRATAHPAFEMKVFCISRHNSVPDTQALPNKNILASLIFCIGDRTVWVRIVLFLLSIYLRRKWECRIKHQMAIEQTLWWAHVSVSEMLQPLFATCLVRSQTCLLRNESIREAWGLHRNELLIITHHCLSLLIITHHYSSLLK